MKSPVKKTWSGIEWDGFEYKEYSLDSKILDYKFGTSEHTELTMQQILERFREQPFKSVESFNRTVTVKTGEDTQVAFGGTPFTADLLGVLLSLQNDGINPFDTSWFCYDSAHALQDVMDSYTFFVMHEGSVVRERISLPDYHESGFDPGLFQPPSEYPPIWNDEQDEERARAAFSFKKFYLETKTGQLYLMSSRPRPYKTEHEIAMETANRLSVGLTRLLWVVIVLLVLIAVHIWL